ncbi:MAG: hypothetical protein AABY95_04985 [Pseudomonadota bacterium]
MTLNQPTYQALPYAYIVAGLFSAALVDSSLRFLPAFLLVAAGVLVLGWRRSARLKYERATSSRLRNGQKHKAPTHAGPIQIG